MVSFGGLLVVLVPLRWLAASPLLPALPAPPWPPALPPFLIHLPLHGPGPPSLPLIHLHSTSHLKLLDFLWSVWKPLFRAAVFNSSPRAPPLCTFCMFLSSLQTFVLFNRKCPAKWTSQDIPPSFQFEASVYVPFKGHWSVRDVNLNWIYLQRYILSHFTSKFRLCVMTLA